MAKDDNTLLLVGGVGVLAFAFIFKDTILKTLGIGQDVPPDDDTPSPTLPAGPQIPQPTKPQLTFVEYKMGMDYYATRIAEEIDKNSVVDINRTTKLNVKGNVLLHHKSEMKAIVDAQNRVLGTGPTSLNEKSLKIFARVLLDVCDRMGITLKSEAKARFQKQAQGKYVLAMKGLIIS